MFLDSELHFVQYIPFYTFCFYISLCRQRLVFLISSLWLLRFFSFKSCLFPEFNAISIFPNCRGFRNENKAILASLEWESRQSSVSVSRLSRNASRALLLKAEDRSFHYFRKQNRPSSRFS